jgi:hypothetical protein
MLSVQVSYKNQQRTTRIPLGEANFEQLENRVRHLFRLWGKPILMFYQEEEDQDNVVLMDDEDVKVMCSCVEYANKSLVIKVKPRSNSLVELGNPHVIQRCCVKELRRKHTKRDSLAKKKLKKDLLAIRKSLSASKMTPKMIAEVIQKISMEIEMFFIEKMLESEEGASTNQKERLGVVEPFGISESSINPASKSASSLFSKTERMSQAFRGFSGLKPFQRFESDTRFDEVNEEHPFAEDDLWIDHDDQGHLSPRDRCKLCKASLRRNIAFRCIGCDKFRICQNCAQSDSVIAQHELEPFYEFNHFQNFLDVFEKVRKKLDSAQLQSAWKSLKDLPGHTKPD